MFYAVEMEEVESEHKKREGNESLDGLKVWVLWIGFHVYMLIKMSLRDI